VNSLKRALLGLAGRHIVFSLHRTKPTLYLTFDDGPHPVHTPALLELLAGRGVRASFFLVGESAEKYPQVVAAIVAAGHTLGNHSFSHHKRKTMGAAAARADVARADAVLARYDGKPRHPFRPPWGEVAPLQFLGCVLGRESLTLWSRNSMDYRDGSGAIVADFRRRPPAPGDIILFHDDHAAALEALQVLIPEWQGRGFEFDALPDDNR
jgi:peptidoglycan/xylan/chitin deacetylase (PgdA/CDA1 family)